ncbi:MAG: ankyrin repeat domain-containing protein [Betaproteobacteria bacterium]
MTTQPPDRFPMQHAPDDLDQAGADAVSLADDGAGPAPSVRANVLAAAREMAAQAPAPVVTPVAAPVAPVGRGRGWAVNLSSWRVRAGGAVVAALLVALTSWRLVPNRVDGENVQLAAAAPSSELSANVVSAPPPADLAPPRLEAPALSAPRVPVPSPSYTAAAPAPARNEVVAQANLPPVLRAARARGEQREDGATASAGDAKLAAAPPVTIADAAPAAPAAPTAPTISPAVEPPVVVAAAPVATTAPLGAAQPAEQRVEITGGLRKPWSVAAADAVKKSAADMPGAVHASSLRVLPTPLHAAADRGDVATLRKLLAEAAVRVDAPDAAGRTALLHAVLAQHLDAVRVLLAAGADADRPDGAGLTPRDAARAGANGEIAAALDAPR